MINPNEILLEPDNHSKLIFFSTILGFSYQGSGRNRDAIAEYDKALEIDPNSVKSHYNKGLALSKIGKNPESRRS